MHDVAKRALAIEASARPLLLAEKSGDIGLENALEM
jgi:hypothetical protein